jgi:hypothetical protein
VSRRGVLGFQLFVEAAVVRLLVMSNEWSGEISKYFTPEVQLL